MKTATNRGRVYEHIKKHGEITNFYAINEMYILRLADVIFRLKKSNRIIVDEQKSGFIEGTKNYRYVAKTIPKIIN